MKTAGRRGSLVTRAITGFAGRAASVFVRIEVRGDPIPDGPVMVVANHQNALLDPLVVFRAAGRPTRPLGKAPLFDQLLLGPMLRALGGLPVYRRQDDPQQMHRNEETFRAAINALLAGDALQIYPEGKSHSQPAIEPLRTGAARIALSAEAERDGRLGLQVVPIGLTWEGKHLFRGRALAWIGKPFTIERWVTPAGADDADAVRGLTDEIAERLRKVTLNLSAQADLDLILAADRIYSRERRIHAYRERDPLAARVPRLRRFAEALEWVRTHEPATHAALASKVRRVDAASRALGAREGAVPRRYPRGAVVRYTISEGLMLILGLPLAVLGTILWYPVWILPRLVVPRIEMEYESVATYKFATSVFTVPATLLAVAFGGFLVWGRWGAALLPFAAMAIGLIALGWRERWGRVKEDAAVYFRLLDRPRLRERLATQRTELAREFDAVLERKGAER
ncbi:MAG: 1-acyl-sn-glycerol-3-phosphate acyltransferase [Gemmatimonadota bacterium]